MAMEIGDWSRFDRALEEALVGWRQRSARLAALTHEPDATRDPLEREVGSSPVPERLVHDETRHALAERSGDPLAAALRPWVETLWLEHVLYPHRLALAVDWGRARAIRGRPRPMSARELRRELLASPHRAVREAAAGDLGECTVSLGDAAMRWLEARVEGEARVPTSCRMLAVADLPEPSSERPRAAVALAEAWLDATDAIAGATPSDAWFDTLADSLAPASREGWPVRPSARWVRSVFCRDDWTRGLALPRFDAGAALGATSYARALGAFGMRILEAGRPRSMPLGMHRHPLGVRKHERRALFAGIAAEPPFARLVLGLDKAGVQRHRRNVARAFALSLRIDAWRVLAADALREGVSVARERQRDLAERVLGRGMPAAFAGVLPMLRAGDGAAFVGAIQASRHRLILVERHDEDWFRNPRAMEEIRDEDSRPRAAEPLDAGELRAVVVALARDLEAILA